MQSGETIFIILTMVFLLAGCTTRPAIPTPIPTRQVDTLFPGGFFTNGDWSLDFKADGTYRAAGPPGSETGTYKVNGNQVTVTCQCCGEVQGSYTWSYDGGTLHFTAIEDKCQNRQGVLGSGEWVRGGG